MRFFILSFLICISFSTVSAASSDVLGKIKDKLTGEVIRAERIITEGCITWRSIQDTKADTISDWYDPQIFSITIKQPGQYVLNITLKGYQPYCDTINIKKIKAKPIINLPDILLKKTPKVRQLGAAVVKSSRVKFYHKGDTLIFDADAFNTADGSMLDALIRQLPGVELKSNGQILVNGRLVESLLLNGEYFFRGKNELMLENLPAYTVKNIKVYERPDEISRLTGQDRGGKDYVMDVRLKKEYSIGWLMNVEGGAGSKDRYLARLFALRFSNHSRLALFGNMNNLNDNRKPGENDGWTPEAMPIGFLATKRAGIDYLAKEKFETYRMEGSAEVSHTDADNYSTSTSETYLPTGNWYGRSLSQSRSKNLNVSTNHTLQYHVKEGLLQDMKVQFSPSLSYSDFDRSSQSAMANFSRDIEELQGGAILDTILQSGENSNLLRQWAINRSINRSLASGHSINFQLPFNFYSIPIAGETFGIYPSMSYQSSRNRTFGEQLVDYPNQTTLATDYRNVYQRNRPDRTVSYQVVLDYFKPITSNTNFCMSYSFGQTFKRHDYEYNLLSRLEGWNNRDECPPLGELPSEVDFRLKTLDAQNSYNHREITTDQVVNVGVIHMGYKGWPYINIGMPITFRHRRLNYYRGNGYDITLYQGVTHKNDVLFNPTVRIHKSFKNKTYWIYPELEYTLRHHSPEMTSLLALENTTDPLNLYTGNADLKRSMTHQARLSIMMSNLKTKSSLNITPSYLIEQNAMAYGYTYAPSTGIRRYRPENINGNYRLALDLNYTRPIDKKQQFTLSAGASGNYRHGVDLIGIDGATSSRRSSVDTWQNNGNISLACKVGKHTFTLKGRAAMGHSSSERENFVSSTLWDFNYGINALIQLPWKVQVSTDLTIYSRRGYGDSGLNTNDLMWNGRVSRKFTKPNITFAIDGFDILNNLHNTALSMNSQGRIETYRSALPNYVMAHLIYHLHVQPKKKNQ